MVHAYVYIIYISYIYDIRIYIYIYDIRIQWDERKCLEKGTVVVYARNSSER